MLLIKYLHLSKRSKMVIATISILLCLFIFVKYVSFGYEYMWIHWRVTPPVVLLVDKEDAHLAHRIGEYYINWHYQGVYDLEKSEKYLTLAHKLDPSLSGPAYHLGRIDFLESQFFAAVHKFSKQLMLYEGSNMPDQYFTQTHYMRALSYGFIGNFDKSAEGFEFLIETNVDDARSWAYYTDLAWVYFQEGRFKEIRDIMEGVSSSTPNDTIGGYERYPNNPWLLNMYGLALFNTGDVEQAYVVLLKADEYGQILTAEEWARAYPGNDPEISPSGLYELQTTIRDNLEMVRGKMDE